MIITQSRIVKLALQTTVMRDFTLYIDNGIPHIRKQGSDVTVSQEGNRTANLLLADWLADTGLIPLKTAHRSYNLFRVAVDILYNHYCEEFFFSNGKIKQSTKTEMAKRIIAGPVSERSYTDILLKRLLDSDWEVTTPHLLHSIKNYTTDKTEYFVNYVLTSIDGVLTKVPYLWDTPAEGGYVPLPNTANIDNILNWMNPNAEFIIIDGVPYLESQLVSCNECGAKAPHLHCGLCKTCLGVDPKLLVIRGYTDRAPAVFGYKTGKYSKELYKEPLYLGIEIEYEVYKDKDSALLYTMRHLKDHAICKRDGSISNGFEIVTAPATFDMQVEAFKPFFDSLPRTMRGKSNTGMHVHISRAPLNMLTQGKLVEFMNREDNRKFLETIAGREANQYTSLDPKRTISYPFVNTQGARYNTLNINNRETLEFRIFATPNNWKDFIQRLDFVQALTAYCSPCQSTAKDLKMVTHHTEFVKYVETHHKDFPYFYSFLNPKKVEEKLMKHTHYKVNILPAKQSISGVI